MNAKLDFITVSSASGYEIICCLQNLGINTDIKDWWEEEEAHKSATRTKKH